MIQLLGAGAFGVLIGWYVYYINRYRADGVQFTDLVTLIGIIGGAAVTALFESGTDAFGAYGIGLAVGFFGYFAILGAFVSSSKNFDVDYFIDGRRIYLYDLYPGGIGYAEKAFEIFEKTLEAAGGHVAACACPAGCPSCVLPISSRYEIGMESSLEYPHPKEAARFLLSLLCGQEAYVPRLEPVAAAPPPPALEPREALDPRVARRVRRAMGKGGAS